MEFSINHVSYQIPAWLAITAGFVVALVIALQAIPTIVRVAQLSGLKQKPNGRSSHEVSTPLFGGVAVFAGFVISTVVIAGVGFYYELKFIIAGLIILFFIGLKDDIFIIDPRKKLIGQVIASLIIIILGDIRIIDFHNFVGIGSIHYIVSLLATLFVFIVIINGFNLIDGIDGLAAGVGILTSVTFGVWFWIAGFVPYTVLCFSLAGALAGFFWFNVFSKTNKIFLGDTGAMVVGLTMAVISVRFLQFEVKATGTAIVGSTASVTMGILIIPLFDTLRVFVLRAANGKSPFEADRIHLHHRLLDLGFSHIKSTIILLSANVFFIVISFLLQDLGNEILLTIILVLAVGLSLLPGLFQKKMQLNSVKGEIE
jgi:UDP-GlcNAc:undecaprenyl-phosphate/decaprenyl-phosphate GlcNAc-1-phosphate transferase